MTEVEFDMKPMIGIMMIAIMAALVIPMVAQAAPAPTTPEPPAPSPGKANLYGKVTDAATGNPIHQVLVTLDDVEALTDDSGDYYFTDLTPGAYTITFYKEGYIEIT